MSNAVDEMTERMLDDAGIDPGMRVLDIGCGLRSFSTASTVYWHRA
jgi:cyclopropane fatty-acyl-phospholipid synthase-like methyltransferase